MSNSYRSVTPHFGDSGAIMLSKNEVNEYVRTHYRSDSDWWQSAFSPFSYMTVSRSGKYTVTGISSSPRFFQKYDSCILYSNTGAIKSNSRSVEACHMYLRDTWCQGDLLSRCYDHLVQYDTTGGEPVITEEGERLYGLYMDEMAFNYKQSMHLTLALGNAFPDLAAMLNDDIDFTNKKALVDSANNTCDGWFTQYAFASQDGKTWLNVPGIINEGDFAAGCEYNGNIHEVVKKLVCEAKPKLQSMIENGNYGSPQRIGEQAQLWVDCDYYSAVISAYEAQCIMGLQNCELITKRQVTANGVTKDVYYIKGMPVVKIEQMSGLNEYMTGKLRFIAIVANGIIQLGNSMGDLGGGQGSEAADAGMGMKIWRQDSTPVNIYDEKGYIKDTKFLENAMHAKTHALTRTVILDYDCMVGAFAYDQGTAKAF